MKNVTKKSESTPQESDTISHTSGITPVGQINRCIFTSPNRVINTNNSSNFSLQPNRKGTLLIAPQPINSNSNRSLSNTFDSVSGEDALSKVRDSYIRAEARRTHAQEDRENNLTKQQKEIVDSTPAEFKEKIEHPVEESNALGLVSEAISLTLELTLDLSREEADRVADLKKLIKNKKQLSMDILLYLKN